MNTNADLSGFSNAALVDSRQAASYLGCSRQWLAILRMQHAGPAYIKHGSWVRYRVADLDSWINRHRVPTGDAA
jgi:predicted DNA-binding transcriptional regulator AlpA